MIFVQPVLVGGEEILLRERLRKIGLRPKRSHSADHRTGYRANAAVHQIIGKKCVDVLIYDVQDDRHAVRVASVNKTLQPNARAKARVCAKEMQRSVAPIEVELGAHHGHQFQAVDAQAAQIREAVDHAIEGVVELLHLQFVDDQIVQFGSTVRGVRPAEHAGRGRQRESRKTSDAGLARERIGEPIRDHLPGSSRRRPTQLEAVQVDANLPKVAARCGNHVHGGSPEVQRTS